MSCAKRRFLLLAWLVAGGAVFGLRAKPLELDKLWTIDAPEEWWYSQIENRGALRVYTFGPVTPDPAKKVPVMLVDQAMKGHAPQVIRGISLGIARRPVSIVLTPGAEKMTRETPGGWLVNGYRTEVDTVDGKLLLHAYVFRAQKLPGASLPNAESRMAIAHIAGKDEQEVEAFTLILEKIKAGAGRSDQGLGEEARADGDKLSPLEPR